jgi:hypothetical protein
MCLCSFTGQKLPMSPPDEAVAAATVFDGWDHRERAGEQDGQDRPSGRLSAANLTLPSGFVSDDAL